VGESPIISLPHKGGGEKDTALPHKGEGEKDTALPHKGRSEKKDHNHREKSALIKGKKYIHHTRPEFKYPLVSEP